ncbi:MAG: LexA family transcriptional regulator [Lachnospiraceae bacterium]|nr:LexA family transcriptional regulator [Lachnospiraceae bacterium]
MGSIGSIIAENRKKNKLTQPMLAKKLEDYGIHISHKTICAWEKDLAEPPIGTFLTICKMFNVPDIYEAYFGENPFDPASKLNRQGREKMAEYAELLIASGKFDKKEPEPLNVIPFVHRRLKLFDIRVSAGTGNFLDSDSFRWKEVGENVPKEADFGVTISGDSMEPQYRNKQIVWVQQTERLENGDIGIFYLNGNAYCKKLQDDENGLYLISLNEKYAPMKVAGTDDFRIFGRILN